MKQKLPLDLEDLKELEKFAKNRIGEDSDTYKAFMIFRYTGCHVSVLVEKERKLHVEIDKDGDSNIIWYRPKKKGEWARCVILKHPNIKFNIDKFVKEFQKRKRKNNRLYLYRLMENLGDKSAIELKEPVSPNTLRHSLAIELLNKGWQDLEVAQLLNVSRKTLDWYGRHSNKGIKNKLKESGWS